MQLDYSNDLDGLQESTLPFGGGPRERGAPKGRGLSLINKVTGVVVSTDTMAVRLGRMRRRVRSWAQSLDGVIQDGRYRVVMITLTYRDVDGWRPNHIRDFMLRVRRLLGDKLVAYAWVAELQKRGAVHYHVLLVVKRGAKIPRPDDAGLWLHGLTRVETARTVYYIVKYAGKEYQKAGEYPKGLRMFAVWMSINAVDAVRYWSYRLSALPQWLSAIVDSIADFSQWPKRAKSGGWWYRDKRYHSPWIVVVT